MVTRRRFLATAAGTGTVLALAACAPAATGGLQSAAPAAPAKSTWNVTIDFKITAIDLGITDEARGLMGHIYEGLVDTVGVDFKLVPRLAERWVRQDPTTTRFFLRKGVKFHNGQELKAADVKYSLDIYGQPTHPYAYLAPWFSKTTVIDDYTVDVTTKTPNFTFIYDLCRLYVMSKSAREADVKAYGDKPIGSGPYQVVNWARTDRLTLKAFPDYWRGVAKPENLVFREILDPSTAGSELLAGGVDIVRNVEFLQAAQLKKDPNLEVTELKGAVTNYFSFDVTKPPFNDKRVRLAMNYGLDRQKLIDTIMLGYAVPLNGPFPRGFLGYDANLKPHPYDPAQAKKLLAEAGFGSGFKTRWSMPVNSYPSQIYKQYQDAAAAQLKEIGVEVQPDPFLGAGHTCDNMGPIDGGVWGVAVDPSSYIGSAYVTKPCRQIPAITELWKKADAAPDIESRGAALREFGRAHHDEGLFLETQAASFLVVKRKEGVSYQLAPYGNGINYQQYFDVTSLKPLG